MPLVAINDTLDIHYQERGQGEPLLLIMGTGADHTFWGYQVPVLAEHYRVIVYDARGVGQSRSLTPPEQCTMAAMADDAAGLLAALGIESAHVSGLSLGSTVAQELALRHPGQVRSLQLHGTWAKSDDWFRRMIETLEYPIRSGDDRQTFIRTALMWILSPHFLQSQPGAVREMEEAFLSGPFPPTRDGLLGHCHADKTHDTLDRLDGIAVPTLVTCGEQDGQVPQRYGRQVVERIPRARWHLFTGPSASHLACLEMPEAFNNLCLEFLADLKATGSC
jgi:pimeloyl-ACP methyl ester carboxylesterase